MKKPTQDTIHAALVLEGGALRSVYTAGILDVFIERGLKFEYIIGVSAGALCGLNYLTRQRGRTAQINTNYVDDPRYISVRNRFRSDGIFSIDYLFEEPNGRWAPFDDETYANENRQYVIGTTNCITGKLDLFEKPNRELLVPALKASCAMPIVSKKVLIDGTMYLDGGIADSVPFWAAMQAGYDKIVVVKTRHNKYRKSADSRKVKALYKALYARQPALYEAVVTRPERYNAQMEDIEKLRKDGSLFVIEPDRPVEVSRAEKDKGKLRALYQTGLTQGQGITPALLSYL